MFTLDLCGKVTRRLVGVVALCRFELVLLRVFASFLLIVLLMLEFLLASLPIVLVFLLDRSVFVPRLALVPSADRPLAVVVALLRPLVVARGE